MHIRFKEKISGFFSNHCNITYLHFSQQTLRAASLPERRATVPKKSFFLICPSPSFLSSKRPWSSALRKTTFFFFSILATLKERRCGGRVNLMGRWAQSLLHYMFKRWCGEISDFISFSMMQREKIKKFSSNEFKWESH